MRDKKEELKRWLAQHKSYEYKWNLNDKIRVELTDKGKEIMDSWYQQSGGIFTDFDYTDDGILEISLSEFIDLFGGHVSNSIVRDEIINFDSSSYNKLLEEIESLKYTIERYKNWVNELKESKLDKLNDDWEPAETKKEIVLEKLIKIVHRLSYLQIGDRVFEAKGGQKITYKQRPWWKFW